MPPIVFFFVLCSISCKTLWFSKKMIEFIWFTTEYSIVSLFAWSCWILLKWRLNVSYWFDYNLILSDVLGFGRNDRGNNIIEIWRLDFLGIDWIFRHFWTRIAVVEILFVWFFYGFFFFEKERHCIRIALLWKLSYFVELFTAEYA